MGTDDFDDDDGFWGAFADIATNAQDTIGAIFGTAADDATSVVLGAQGTISGALDSAQDVAIGAQSTIQNVAIGGQQALVEVANPFNLLGFGAGLSAGAVAVTGVFVVGGAALADEVFAGGAGRMALFGLFKRSSSRRRR